MNKAAFDSTARLAPSGGLDRIQDCGDPVAGSAFSGAQCRLAALFATQTCPTLSPLRFEVGRSSLTLTAR